MKKDETKKHISELLTKMDYVYESANMSRVDIKDLKADIWILKNPPKYNVLDKVVYNGKVYTVTYNTIRVKYSFGQLNNYEWVYTLSRKGESVDAEICDIKRKAILEIF